MKYVSNRREGIPGLTVQRLNVLRAGSVTPGCSSEAELRSQGCEREEQLPSWLRREKPVRKRAGPPSLFRETPQWPAFSQWAHILRAQVVMNSSVISTLVIYWLPLWNLLHWRWHPQYMRFLGNTSHLNHNMLSLILSYKKISISVSVSASLSLLIPTCIPVSITINISAMRNRNSLSCTLKGKIWAERGYRTKLP